VTADAPIAAALRATDADALDDRAWFVDRPDRRFRAHTGGRGLWVIRRVPQGSGPDVYLRTFGLSQRLPGDNDGASASAWYAAAYPDWPIERVLRRARKALKKRST
jgi:hypothetical protein